METDVVVVFIFSKDLGTRSAYRIPVKNPENSTTPFRFVSLFLYEMHIRIDVRLASHAGILAPKTSKLKCGYAIEK